MSEVNLSSLNKKELLGLIKEYGLIGNNTEKVEVLRSRIEAHLGKEPGFGNPLDFPDDAVSGEEEFNTAPLVEIENKEPEKVEDKAALKIINTLVSLIKDVDKINDKKKVDAYGTVRGIKSDNMLLVKALLISSLEEYLILKDANLTVLDALANYGEVSENVDSINKLFGHVSKVKSLILIDKPSAGAIKQLYFVLLGLRHTDLIRYA
jgi:hypothetical protein